MHEPTPTRSWIHHCDGTIAEGTLEVIRNHHVEVQHEPGGNCAERSGERVKGEGGAVYARTTMRARWTHSGRIGQIAGQPLQLVTNSL